ncbi:MAG: DUF2017 domain-containing protein [Actinomycetota bacterium]|nr:DUF2017 domain-containing protein [Actinomycetota bacterium]
MTARFRRRGGAVVARFTAQEADVLRQMVGEVLELLGGPEAGTDDPLGGLGTAPVLPADPALARLLPDGYRDDPAAAGELRRLTESSLRADKVRNAQVLLDALPEAGGTVTLSGEEAQQAWLRALNDVRLALGTRLNVTEDLDLGAEVAADPDSTWSYALLVYDWMGWLQETLIRSVPLGR